MRRFIVAALALGWILFVGHSPAPLGAAEPLPAPQRLAPALAFDEPRQPEVVFWNDDLPHRDDWQFPAYKPTWVQQLRYLETDIMGRTGSQMGENDPTLEGTLAVPWTVLGSPWLITPHFGARLLYGPETTDMPGHLFHAFVEFGRLYQLLPHWQLETAYAPSVFSDFDNSRSDAFRVTGRVVSYYSSTPTTQVVLGATYLGRRDYPVLPVVGMIWEPSERTRVEAVFPRPKFMQRLALPLAARDFVESPLGGTLGLRHEDEYWWYLRGDLGGNSYAIRRASGADDFVTTRDFRFTIGYERRGVQGLTNRSEIGIAFGRDLWYASTGEHVPLTDALMFRTEYAY